MKTKPFPATTLLAVTAAVLLCGQITAASAAETKSSEQESSAPLEQVMGRINQLEDGFAKKREATCAIIETEVAAKHITDATAFELRHALRLTGTASIDFRAIFTGPKTATDNEKILKSLKELETDCDLTSDHIKAAVPELGNGLRQRVRETVLGKPKPDEIQNLLKTLEQMRSTMLKKGFLNSDQQIPWEEAFSILKALKRLVEAENAPFSDELPQAAAFFRNSTPKGIMGEGAIRARLDRTLDPVAKTFETKRAALDAALEARKPFTEISLAVAAYAEVVKRLDRMQSERFTNIAESLNFYQSLATAFEAIAGDDDPKALEYLRFAKGQLHQAGIGSDKPEKYPPLVAAIEQELRDKLAKLIARNISDTSVRLAAAKSPDDLKSLSKDIMAWEQQQMPPPGAERPYRRGQIGGGLGEMARPLETLASAWAQGDPAILYRHDAVGGDQYRGPCAKELTELHNRIEHDLFATILKAHSSTARDCKQWTRKRMTRSSGRHSRRLP